jgi:acetyltransferase-like isoleucine patch superfamily enzyme
VDESLDEKGCNIEIGEDVVISPGVRIITHNHQFYKSNWRELGDVVSYKNTIIMAFAFIGVNAILTHSCKYIGLYSVIGAGSVVTKDVPDYEVWAGNPAKKIGRVAN